MNATDEDNQSWVPTQTTTIIGAQTISPYYDYLFTGLLFIIHNILDPCVLCLGLVGNILAFLVLLQPQYRNQTTCLYMRILAVFDTSIILLKNVQVRPSVLLCSVSFKNKTRCLKILDECEPR
jgi:hypothetical protein